MHIVSKWFYGSFDEEVIECSACWSTTESHYCGSAELVSGPVPAGAECWRCAERRAWEAKKAAQVSEHEALLREIGSEIREALPRGCGGAACSLGPVWHIINRISPNDGGPRKATT